MPHVDIGIIVCSQVTLAAVSSWREMELLALSLLCIVHEEVALLAECCWWYTIVWTTFSTFICQNLLTPIWLPIFLLVGKLYAAGALPEQHSPETSCAWKRQRLLQQCHPDERPGRARCPQDERCSMEQGTCVTCCASYAGTTAPARQAEQENQPSSSNIEWRHAQMPHNQLWILQSNEAAESHNYGQLGFSGSPYSLFLPAVLAMTSPVFEWHQTSSTLKGRAIALR